MGVKEDLESQLIAVVGVKVADESLIRIAQCVGICLTYTN